jgi:N-acetyl sugar amidotransferase
MPETKPDLRIDEQGICNACRSFERRPQIDWNRRASELEEILGRYRSGGKYWDCVIPVSGGKDSTYQVLRMLEMGMTPLAVNARIWEFTDVGRRNIEAIKELGVDVIEFSPNPVVRRKISRIGLKQVGDCSWPEHVGIFTIPVVAAVKYQIPLIIWGENSQDEYGGPATAAENRHLDRRWLEEFGGLLGLRVTDLEGMEGLTRKDLVPYIYPSDEEMRRVGVTGLFLGYFMPWDGLTNALIAQCYGFESYPKNIEGTMVGYENLDNYYVGMHDYFKFLKYGYSRATDQTCLHVRRGRLDRKDAIKIVRRHDGQFPWTYLGKPLEELLKPLEFTLDEFIALCDRFTNRKIFLKDAAGGLLKDARGNLTKINYDNA